eukprot:5423744-Alexandrium_andersonii.AAC.1
MQRADVSSAFFHVCQNCKVHVGRLAEAGTPGELWELLKKLYSERSSPAEFQLFIQDGVKLFGVKVVAEGPCLAWRAGKDA